MNTAPLLLPRLRGRWQAAQPADGGGNPDQPDSHNKKDIPMPRRKARHRNSFGVSRLPVLHLQSHRTIVRHLRRLVAGKPWLDPIVDAFETDPTHNLHVPNQLIWESGPEAEAEAEAETMRRLEELSASLRKSLSGAGTDKTPLPPHDAHAPRNSLTQTDLPPAPEPSPGNSGEAPPRPRALYL